MAVHAEQVAVSRHDELGVAGHSCGDDVIVVGIAWHDTRHLGRCHHFDDLDVIGQHRLRGLADGRQPLGRRRPRQHIGQFFQQRRAADELHITTLAYGKRAVSPG